MSSDPRSSSGAPAAHGPLGALVLGAIGVVYGDIGTSPLYTMAEVFSPANGVPLTAEAVTGAVSTLFWALMFVVTLKYVVLVLRADNRGEGGILALTALAAQVAGGRPGRRAALLMLGVFGATLFYGDSVITPAISVLGAVEGLAVIAPGLSHAVLPLSLVVLVGLFAMQRHGTAAVGRLFGPVIVLWFLTLAGTGLWQILREPAILAALNPLHAARFLVERGWHVFAALGAIVLALTGAEALYADMGHFGRRPIQLAWTGLVLPALALNYLGQGALLLRDPAALANPFFHMFPQAWQPAAVVLATLAAIIASQAVISGAFSMTRQSMLMGFLPRMAVRHTSAREQGQIYLPLVNWALLVGVLAAVLSFRSSAALAGAYGVAVTLTMLITTVLAYVVVRRAWGLPAWVVGPATALFLVVDGALFAGCAIKFVDGGWFPLAMAALFFTLMSTWRHGRALVLEAIRRDGLELAPFVQELAASSTPRASRVAVYAVADPSTVPQALLHNLKHNQVLHERNVILNVRFADQPWVDPAQRAEVEALAPGFWRVRLLFGFMETPDVPHALAACAAQGLDVPLFDTSYFLSRETVVPTPGEGMVAWRERLFAAMSRNAGNAAGFFQLPDNAVVELGTRVQI
ncbi:potassium transporter Kup [Ideonella dechloratans]|uniref:Probable potassium transport system protein Kup n=1 Tax=Ideonella dechloratans TaxID=36863 RepID=A0A643FGC8_IDEDE|nr:potassium transporter Kup [Ideonella dechloratans]KAB0584386.1 potassium transporter Kup [Ideonella dechloratans]UFU10823.1 potassium transporter Kup [Ideonella dechloratans]